MEKKNIFEMLPDATLNVKELLNIRGGIGEVLEDALDSNSASACGCSRMCKKKACKTKAV